MDKTDVDATSHYVTSAEDQPLLLNSQEKRSTSNLPNVVMLGGYFCVLFVAFNTMQSFEAKLNKQHGLTSLATLYLCFSVSNLVAGTVVTNIGERISLFIGAVTYAIYLGANLYPRIETLVPAAALLGFGASILWTAQGSYMAKNSDSTTLGYHSGVFFGLFMLNAVIGNLGAAIALEFNISIHYVIWSLFIIAASSTFLFLTLRKPKVIGDVPVKKGINIMEILYMFTEPKMLIFIPVIVYSGFSQSFFNGKILQTMPEKLIGYVMACFGVCDMLSSVVLGRLSDIVGRRAIVIFATILGAAGYASAWFVSEHRIWLYFVTMSLLGVSDAGYNTQMYAVIGTFQKDKIESGYAFLKFWQSATTAIAFFYSLALDLHEIIIVIGSALGVSIISFLICDLCVARVDDPDNKK